MTRPTDGAEPRAEPTTPPTATRGTAPAMPPALPQRTTDDAQAAPAGRSVQYKGADLDAERGPGLGCFRFQLVLLAVLLIVTPLGVNAGWPDWLSAALLFITLGLLLVAGQTVIFLLRLVAAERRGRRRPLASATRTVGELEDAAADAPADAPAEMRTGGRRETPDPDARDEPDANVRR